MGWLTMTRMAMGGHETPKAYLDARRNDILAQARVMKAMRSCTFSDDSPERDMAWFEVDGIRVMMKIDYYDAAFEYGSEDPANAAETRRAITLMKPEDY